MDENMVNNLLNEFYHPTTSNDRKRQIEFELINYKNHPNSWQQSLLSIQHQDCIANQFLWFFNASILEFNITKRWYLFKQQDRATIRNTLWALYTNLSVIQTPKRQRNTVAQLLVLMGKRDFPDEYPDYVNNIIELLKNNCTLGIVLLRITSEEIANPRDDITSEKKKYFHSCISLCLPEIMNVMESILHSAVREVNQETLNILSLPIDHQNSDFNLIYNKLFEELLNCVQQLFSWISLDLVSDSFLISIFELSRWRTNYPDISVGALTVINELFYIQRSIPLPNTVMKGIKLLLQQENLQKSNELYQDKFTELLRLYTNKFWSKLINDNEVFPSLVAALYHYTFSGYGALAFTERLEAWTPIIKGLTLNDYRKYSDIMHSLVNGILKKIEFRFDQEQELDTLDNEVLDDNMETEWQHYLTQCIETIALVAEGDPIWVFDTVFYDWECSYKIFKSLQQLVIQNNDVRVISVTGQSECHFIHCTLRDLSTLCQTIVRLTTTIEKCYDNCLQNLNQIKQNLLFLIKFLSINQFHFSNNIESSVLKTDISELYSQAILALRSLLACPKVINSDAELKFLIEEVGKILLPNPHQQSRIVTLASSQLLLRIATVIRPKFMLECNSILQLMQAGPNLSHLPKQVSIVVHQFIISCLVFPWSNVDNINQNTDQKNITLQNYVAYLANDFFQVDDVIVNDNNSKILAITSVLPILRDIIDFFKECSSAIKQKLSNCFKCILIKSLSVYRSYGCVNSVIAESIFDFALSALRCLQVQLGSTFIQEMISIFVDSFSREQMTSNQLKSMEKILRMLLLVVEQPGSSTISLIPSILNLALYHALPWLQDDNNCSNESDALYLLFSLFDGILQHRWQYFYKSQVLRGFSPGASDYEIPSDEIPQHADQLLAILTSYGQILVGGQDPHLNRIILTSLQNLNDKWKLYNRDFFKDNLLQSFQHAIINSIFSAEGAIYYDLLLSVLFSMGKVNVNKLHDAFISLGYKDSLIICDICSATDLPTFSQKITQLVQDTRCIIQNSE